MGYNITLKIKENLSESHLQELIKFMLGKVHVILTDGVKS